MVNFPKWLDAELEKREWSRADLSQKAKISQSALSMIYSENRKAGPEICNAVASALKLPPEEVFRAAGLLPPAPATDETIERIDYLLSTLQDPNNKQRALDYIELLKTQEERAKYNAAQPRATQPR